MGLGASPRPSPPLLWPLNRTSHDVPSRIFDLDRIKWIFVPCLYHRSLLGVSIGLQSIGVLWQRLLINPTPHRVRLLVCLSSIAIIRQINLHLAQGAAASRDGTGTIVLAHGGETLVKSTYRLTQVRFSSAGCLRRGIRMHRL